MIENALATFRIRGLGGLRIPAGRGEQPHGRRVVASLRLSDSGSAAAGGMAGALMLGTS